MAKATVKIYNGKGDVVDELPYGTNGIIGTGGTGQRQQVHVKTDESGNKTYFAPGLSADTDPFGKAALDIDEYVEIQAPQVKIDNGQVTLNAPQEVLDTPFAEQVRQELQTLKGSDLNSQEVKDAIDALNEEIKNTIKNLTVKGTLGWTSEGYTDYQRLLQAVRQANPMSSSDYFYAKRPGADFYTDENGIKMSKTPKEWIDYWKKTFTPEQRTQLYKKSLESDDPYERVMGLIMSAGGAPNEESGYAPAIYGYDQGEYVDKFWETAREEMELFPKGVFRTLNTSEDVKRVEDLSRNKKLDLHKILEDIGAMSWNAEDEDTIFTPWTKDEKTFEDEKNAISGKTWDELSDAQKLFVIELGVSKENSSARSVDRDMRLGDQRYTAEDLENISSDNKSVSREAIKDVLINSTYDRVKQINSDLWKWQAWDEENINNVEQKHIDNSLWASGNVRAGNFAGTIGRFLWENMVGKALTGGHSMNHISDVIAGSAESGTGLLGWLAKHNISPTSKVGSGLLQFGMRLVGNVPEDIVQNAVDNVVTYRSYENENLFNPEQMSEDFKNDLIFMAAADAVMAGVSAIKRAKLIKKLSKEMDLDKDLNMDGLKVESIMEAADEAARAASNGGEIEVKDGKVYIVDSDGKASILEGVTTDQAQMLKRRIQELNRNGLTEAQKTSATSSIDFSNANLKPENVEDLTAKRNAEATKLKQLETQKQKWVDNDYKDENGLDVRQREQTEYSMEEIYGTSKLEKTESEIEDTKRNIAALDQEIEDAKKATAPDSARAKYNEAVDKIKKTSSDIDTDNTPKTTGNDTGSTVKVETDTPDGRVEVDVKDYNFKSDSPDDVLDANIKIEATPPGIRHWHNRAVNALMRNLRTNLQEFHARFGDVRASDFDWIWYNSKIKHLPVSEIIGTTDPTTGRMVTQNMIDAVKWWGDQDFTKKPRMASLKSLGKNVEDTNDLGYLPHTSYDPATQTLEEARRNTGALWQKATGKSVMKDGEYVGYGGTLEGRYRTFASNMLWDAKNTEVLAAKLIQEAALDGKKLSPDEAMNMAKKVKGLDSKVNSAKSSKNLEKGAKADGSDGLEFYKKASKEIEEEAPNSGAGKAVHDVWGEAYMGADNSSVKAQPKAATTALDTQGNTMRKIVTDDGNMYENGGAAMVYAPQDAFIAVSRVEAGDMNVREAVFRYVRERSGRSEKYANIVTDRIMAKLASDVQKNDGRFTKGLAIQSLSNSFRAEAWSRYRRWLARAKFDDFNESTRKFIDDFTFRHMQMDSYVNNQGIITKITNGLLNLRYDALFYANLKNALLQVSELNRLFTSFKYRDVGGMLKRLATDADFRAEVDMYVNAVAPKTSYIEAALYEKYGKVSDAMEVDDDGVRFKKIKDGKKTLDDIMLAPINKAEALKNRTMVAALVQEADRLEASGRFKNGSEKLMWIRQKFERVALAQNEMGRIGLASNSVAKPFLFLQNFQMRELGMHLYNIFDPEDLDTGGKLAKGTALNAVKYAIKVFGTKLGTALILSRLGYNASQILGFDPLGIANNYTGLSDEEKTSVDEQLTNGVLTPFVAGGMTSLFADMYFMARKAYEDANRKTVADDAEANLNKNANPLERLDWSVFSNPNTWLDFGKNLIPGYTAANRIEQMNEMMSSGWAVSNTGNKMYTAPDNGWDSLKGYLFGRSATQNALNYNQNYGNDLGQTLSRMVVKPLADTFGGGYNQFDPIDSKNYTDWFDGSDNDTQQFEKGRRYFNNRKKEIIKIYTEVINDNYSTDEEKSEAKNDMNEKLNNLFEDLARFVDAYEDKHGTITGKMVKSLVNILNTEYESATSSDSESGQSNNNKALERYVQLGLPNVGTYTGPSVKYPNTEPKYQGSPQWRVKSKTGYNLQSEAAAVLEAGDAVLKDLRKELKDVYSKAVQTKDYTEFNKAQKEYLKAFDNVVGPIIATYGRGVLNSRKIKDQLEDMLSTSSNSGKNIGNLIPFEQYGKDKRGRYRSMPNESVNVVKWALERYDSNIFKNPTIRSYSTAQDDIDTIKRLAANGQNDMAWARALSLKVRIDNQKRSLNKSDYQWLLNFLNNGGK